VLGLAEALLHVAEVEGDLLVHVAVRPVLVDAHVLARQRLLDGHDGGQRLVVHADRRRGVDGFRVRFRDDERDRIADVPHTLAHEQRARRPGRRRAVTALARAIRRQIAEAVGGDIGARQDRQHTRRCDRRARVDRRNARMGMRRAHEHGVHLARQVNVVGIAAEPAQEPPILHAAHGLADGELLDADRLAHDYLSFRSSAGPTYG
jgi:hypothetical protein